MKKREAALKSAFGAEMHRRLPGFLMLHHASRGAPDRSITGLGRTTWWEFKHATPDFNSPGDQELMCMRLDAAGFCRYVLWWEREGIGQRTMIATPKAIHNRSGWNIECEAWCPGFDHAWLVHYIYRLHV